MNVPNNNDSPDDKAVTTLENTFHLSPSSDSKYGSLICLPEANLVLGLFPLQCSFIFYGRAKCTHVYGPSANVHGYQLDSNPPRQLSLHSPTSHSHLTIQIVNTLSTSYESSRLWTCLLSALDHYLSKDQIADKSCEKFKAELNHYITASDGKSFTALLFQTLHDPRLESITRVGQFRNLYSLDLPGSLVLTQSLARRLGFNFTALDRLSSSTSRLLTVSSSMQEAALDFVGTCSSPNRCLLAGPKGAGKSTMLRFLVNNLLSRSIASPTPLSSVAILDCDIGQSEFTPSGVVSLTLVKQPLLGPPFSHPVDANDLQTISHCFVGSLSPAEDPDYYLRCLEFVFKAFDQLPDPKPPLIVNTMGWTQGIGLMFLIEQILLIQPNIIIQLNLGKGQSGSRHNLPTLDAATLRDMSTFKRPDLTQYEFNHKTVTIQSEANYSTPNQSGGGGLPRQFGAPDHRDLTLLAHLVCSLCRSRPSQPLSEAAFRFHYGHAVRLLLSRVPFRVDLASRSAPYFRVIGDPVVDEIEGEEGGDTDGLDMLLRQINASLVALCRLQPDQKQMLIEKKSGRVLKENIVCECIGLAICRAIDLKHKVAYFTSGLSPAQFSSVDLVVRGSISLPNCFFTEQPMPNPRYLTQTPPQLPYTGPVQTQGSGRSGLPSRRHHPRTSGGRLSTTPRKSTGDQQ